jgi:hypothetical protein
MNESSYRDEEIERKFEYFEIWTTHGCAATTTNVADTRHDRG